MFLKDVVDSVDNKVFYIQSQPYVYFAKVQVSNSFYVNENWDILHD